jgi:hypothetical protein
VTGTETDRPSLAKLAPVREIWRGDPRTCGIAWLACDLLWRGLVYTLPERGDALAF